MGRGWVFGGGGVWKGVFGRPLAAGRGLDVIGQCCQGEVVIRSNRRGLERRWADSDPLYFGDVRCCSRNSGGGAKGWCSTPVAVLSYERLDHNT